MTPKTKVKPAREIVLVPDNAISAVRVAYQGTAVLPPRTKVGCLRERLKDPGGASLTTLMELTGWQAHTIRAALTGLRKTGLAIIRWREGMETFYKADGGATTEGPAADKGAAMAGQEVAAATKAARAIAAIEALPSSAPAKSAGKETV